jgi:hypothetical protein
LNVIRWQPPWPLIQISDNEWVIMRDQAARPAALVRYIKDKPDSPYRVVRWAPDPGDRRLFEYFRSLEMADMAVTFIDGEPNTGRTALSSERSPEWGRFERWFWSQAPERLIRESLPSWVYKERLAQHANP